MTKQRINTTVRGAILCILVIGTAGFGMSRLMGRPELHVGRAYQPNAVTPRVRFLGDPVADAVFIRDFDVRDEEIYLLDPMAARVFVMHESAGHWSLARAFGRHGGGPGELMRPTGIAVSDSSVTVVDGERLHHFDRNGAYLKTTAPSVPCPLLNAHVYDAPPGLLLSGRCVRADTATAELFLIRGDSAIPVAHDPLFTRDGTVGSILAADNFYTPGTTHGLFGGGTGDCAYSVATDSARFPVVARICGLSGERYPFIVSDEYRAKARALAASRPGAAGVMDFPSFLPTYLDRLPSGSDFILRPFSNDSFAFRRVGRDRDVLIAEVEGLVGCRAAGCLWVRQDTMATMMFLPASVVDGAVVMRR
jgi:hypothetical protein